MGPYGDEDQDQQQPQANAGQRPGMAQRMAGTAGRFLQNRYRAGQQGQNGSMSMRQDGQKVPGNQPGGQNGSYGPYGQSPQSQPPAEPPAGRPTFGSQVAGGMQGGQPIGRAVVGAAMNRYRAPQQQNPASASGPPPAAPQSNVMARTGAATTGTHPHGWFRQFTAVEHDGLSDGNNESRRRLNSADGRRRSRLKAHCGHARRERPGGSYPALESGRETQPRHVHKDAVSAPYRTIRDSRTDSPA